MRAALHAQTGFPMSAYLSATSRLGHAEKPGESVERRTSIGGRPQLNLAVVLRFSAARKWAAAPVHPEG